MQKRILLLLLSLVVPASRLFGAPSNAVVITDRTGATQAGRPISISRVFAQGEILNYPQPRAGATPLSVWQADVKNRWPDGSVKHAIISFSYAVPANGAVSFDFINSANPCSSGAQSLCDAAALTTASSMLNPPWMTTSWDAQMELTNGTLKTVNARTLLNAISFDPTYKTRYWLRGPAVTQVIVEDRSSALSQDVGWDAAKSLHPYFVLTFYNGWQGVKVEFIVENCWTTKLEDIAYSLSLKASAGGTLSQVYSKPSFTHLARSRWHKTYWAGNTPGEVKTDLNLAYMTYSKAVPNYDTSKVVSSAAKAQALTDFNVTDKGDIMGTGQYTPAFGTTGGRPELGYLEKWATQYLFTFDPTLLPVLLGNGDASGHVPIHFRESSTGRFFDSQGTVDAFGRVLSIDARPSITSLFFDYANAQDKITPITPVKCRQDWYLGCSTTYDATSVSPWMPDLAHQSAFGFVPYLVTGDYYWLEEMHFWSAFNVAVSGAGPGLYGRFGSWGIMHEAAVQGRGTTWAIRNLAHAQWFSPDTPESSYFLQKLNANLATKEGQYNVTNGAFYNTSSNSPWSAGYTTLGGNVANPLSYPFYMDPTVAALTPSQGDAVKVHRDFPVWWDTMWMMILGRLDELGYPADKLKAVCAKHLIHILQDPTFSPYMIGSYGYPMYAESAGFPYFSSWTSVLAALTPTYRSTIMTTFPSDVASPADPDFGYVAIGYAASAYLPAYSDGVLTGQNARNWMERNIPTQLSSNMNDNPKWAILPRQTTSTPPPTIGCDLNGDGRADVIDVQLAVNQALSVLSCTTGNLNGDGRCDILDVQRIVLAAIGGACKVGP